MAAPYRDEDYRAAIAAANKVPMLTLEEEQALARRWTQHGDTRAFDKLVRSHMRLAVATAGRYARSGLPVADLISEAYVGLVKGVQRFDPDRGFRLATCATWWIRAEVQMWVYAHWSSLKGGSTPALKKLFFGLRRAQRSLGIDTSMMSDEQAEKVAEHMGVTVEDVREMERRFATLVVSIHAPINAGSDGSEVTLLETIKDEQESLDVKLSDQADLDSKRKLLREALDTLSPRERDIFIARNMTETPVTLEYLSRKYGVTRR